MQDLQILYVPDTHRLEILLQTALDLPTIQRVIEKSLNAIDEYQCNNILFDIRQTLSIISAAQNFDLVTDLESLGWRPEHKWAILYQNDPHIYKIAAQLIQSSGVKNVSFFEDRTKALAWLS